MPLPKGPCLTWYGTNRQNLSLLWSFSASTMRWGGDTRSGLDSPCLFWPLAIYHIKVALGSTEVSCSLSQPTWHGCYKSNATIEHTPLWGFWLKMQMQQTKNEFLSKESWFNTSNLTTACTTTTMTILPMPQSLSIDPGTFQILPVLDDLQKMASWMRPNDNNLHGEHRCFCRIFLCKIIAWWLVSCPYEQVKTNDLTKHDQNIWNTHIYCSTLEENLDCALILSPSLLPTICERVR